MHVDLVFLQLIYKSFIVSTFGADPMKTKLYIMIIISIIKLLWLLTS